MPKNSIYKGTLMHKRFVPKEHKFTYSIFYTLINIDDLDDLKKKYIFFLIIVLIYLVFMTETMVLEIIKKSNLGS